MRSWLVARHVPLPIEADLEVMLETERTVNSGLRVLVADDNPVNLMLVSELMECRGIVPLLAADGAEALALACELSFDIILMDLQMPVLDGLAATARIRRFEDLYSRLHTPVVAYSSMNIAKALLSHHGLDGTLSKPCSDDELEECLVRWCPRFQPWAGSAPGLRS